MPTIHSMQSEALQIVKIVISLLQYISNSQINLHYIMREDVIDVFYGNKNNNVSQKELDKLPEYPAARIQTRLHPQKFGLYLLDWLIAEEVINQNIELQQHPDSSVLTYFCRIIGVKENAKAFIITKSWNLYIK
jgi:hypothetical protein